jgi:hypothetical protein
MIRILAWDIPFRIQGYVRKNWGAPFITVFMSLLVIVAFLVLLGLPLVADAVAVYAYYALVLGVIGQLVCHLTLNKRIGEKNIEPN